MSLCALIWAALNVSPPMLESPVLVEPASPDDAAGVVVTAPQTEPRRTARRGKPTYKVVEFKDGGTLEGVVKYDGALPPPRKIQIVKDQPHCGKRSTQEPLIKTDKEGRVAEAVVFLADITAGKPPQQRAKPATIEQRQCEFHPHIQAVLAKEPVEIINADEVAHNIQADQRIYTIFNIQQPAKNMKARKAFDEPGLATIKCNVHDWMNGFVYVFIQPYFGVTGADGAFKLENIPPGKYQLAIWQEHLGEQVFDIEIKAGETLKQEITLKPKGETKTTAAK